jgi:threonine/homoserine/homoserine lactone efflux protein
MALKFFFKGMVVGFSIAAPVGPIGILCMRRTLANGRLIGFSSGLGAATADAAYGAIAAFGLAAISNFLIHQKSWFGIVGGIFLCFLGIKIFFSKPAKPSEETHVISLVPAFFSTLFLTLTNPTTIISFIAIFAGLGLVRAANYLTASSLVAGIFIGSTIWWLILSVGFGFFRSHFDEKWMKAVNWLSGFLIFAFGIYSFWLL